MKGLACLLLVTVLVSISQSSVGAEFQFKCPEQMTPQERKKQTEEFWDYCRKEHPDWTIGDLMDYEAKLLEENGCGQPSGGPGTSAKADGHTRYLCVGKNGERHFSFERSAGCKEIRLERGWVNFSLDPSAIVDVKSGSVVSEPDGKTVWVRFYLASVYDSEDGIWSYDYVESMHKFYCGREKTSLVKGTYKLDGRTVHVQPESESVIETVDPGTLNEALYDSVCGRR